MNKFSHIRLAVWGLGVATTTAAWSQSPQPPKILYGTTTSLAAANEFAVATTAFDLGSARAKYVVVAEANDNKDLEVLAWHDTTSSLESIGGHGIADHQRVVSVAVTALDPNRVVTADINKAGVLSVDTWKVGREGVVSQRGYRTAGATASKDVAIAAVSYNEVVTAYETTKGNLVVEAWTIGEDGLPAPKSVLGKGPSVFEVSVAAIGPNQVVTAGGGNKGELWVNTWELTNAGVKPVSEAGTENALSTACIVAPRPQTVSVGAGQSFELVNPGGSSPHYDFVRAVFTPVITPACQLQVYYWSVSESGALTLQSTTTPTEAGDFGQVAASMLPANIPITSYTGGTGDNSVFIEWYKGFNLLDPSSVSYGDPYGALNVGSAPAGTDLSPLSLFRPYNAYFISAGQFGPEESVPDGTLFINVLSYPEASIL
jgi:hypothetical protein